jgi:2-phospho-L-lactate guanylyltransferase
MAEHVLRTLRATPGIERVLVVTSSAEVRHCAHALGAEILHEPHEAGTAEACRFALSSGMLHAAAPVLFVSGDLPLMATKDISELLQRAAAGPSIVIVPDRRRQGTNALWCSTPGVVPPCFGPGSFTRHIEQAQARGVAVTVHDVAALALDIDEVSDLQHLRAGSNTRGGVTPELWREWLDSPQQVAAL